MMTFMSRVLQIAIAYLCGKMNYVEDSVSIMKEISYVIHESAITERSR